MDSRTQLLDDPFWSVVAARHPDLEIVLLPGAAADVSEPEVSAPVVEATAEQVAGFVGIIDDARSTLGLPFVEQRQPEVLPGPESGTVEVRLKHTGPDPAGAQALARIAEAADHAVQRDGEVLRLSGSLGLLRVQATWARATEMLVVRVTSPVLRVGTDVADELLGRA